MEMGSTRRPNDGSLPKEPGLKKLRLTDDGAAPYRSNAGLIQRPVRSNGGGSRFTSCISTVQLLQMASNVLGNDKNKFSDSSSAKELCPATSARLALPAPQGKSIISATENRKADQNSITSMNTLQLPSPQANEMDPKSGVSNSQPVIEEPPSPEPIIEVSGTPEPDYTQLSVCDSENAFNEDPDEIPAIQINIQQFADKYAAKYRTAEGDISVEDADADAEQLMNMPIGELFALRNDAIRNKAATLQLPSPQANEMDPKSGVSNSQPVIEEPPSLEPIIEVSGTPEPDYTQLSVCDIENAFNEDPDEIPTEDASERPQKRARSVSTGIPFSCQPQWNEGGEPSPALEADLLNISGQDAVRQLRSRPDNADTLKLKNLPYGERVKLLAANFLKMEALIKSLMDYPVHYEEHSTTISKLKKDLQEMKKKLDTSEASATLLQQGHDQLRKDNEQLQKDNELLRVRLASLEEDKIDLKGFLSKRSTG